MTNGESSLRRHKKTATQEKRKPSGLVTNREGGSQTRRIGLGKRLWWQHSNCDTEEPDNVDHERYERGKRRREVSKGNMTIRFLVGRDTNFISCQTPTLNIPAI